MTFTERFTGTAVGHDGRILKTASGPSVRYVISILDASHANSTSACVRGEFTTDGTYHGPGKGRVVASREPRTIDGSFYSGWILE